ncbi:SWIM zinc finger family protein [Streptomyces sp. NPDC005438]|uniref:SWIM zinc finger family protein n=1 Tax=Streptomyces sp. NPDC005438 TaxID=3156880 RepID=UPI0033AADAFA
MTDVGVRWTAEQVLALAPDAASRKAGGKLSAPGPWSGTGAGADAVWGLCQGTGRKPYQTVAHLPPGGAAAFRCSCPSGKVPCKHALGLLLLWADPAGPVAAADQPPEWADGWLTDRRQRAAPAGASDSAATRAPADPEAARRRAERRMGRVREGAADLQRRLEDLLHRGLAGADQQGYADWEEMAARMVDAQAPGLASRTRALGTLPGSGPHWPERLLSECALLRLLAQSADRLDQLPAPLASTVRARLGLSVDASEVLARGPLVHDHWLVLAQQDAVEGRLTVRRTWLHGTGEGGTPEGLELVPSPGGGRMALLMDFAPRGGPLSLNLPVGTVLDAELAYYPGASPLRATLGPRGGTLSGRRPRGGTLDEAAGAYAHALRGDPWLDEWPVVLDQVVPLPQDDGRPWLLASDQGTEAVPLTSAVPGSWRMLAVSGGAPLTVFGTFGHRGFTPYAVWADERVTPL